MVVKDLSNSFNPVPKSEQKKVQKTGQIKQKSKKMARLEKNRFSIITKDLEHCYVCTQKGLKNISKEDLHEIFGGRNRKRSIEFGLVIPLCRKCHNLIENDETLKQKWHKVGQKEFKKYYKTENFVQIFGKNYL